MTGNSMYLGSFSPSPSPSSSSGSGFEREDTDRVYGVHSICAVLYTDMYMYNFLALSGSIYLSKL